MARRRAVPGISLKLDHVTLREGVNTLEQLAARVTFDFDPPAPAPACGARGRQLCSPTPTVTT